MPTLASRRVRLRRISLAADGQADPFVAIEKEEGVSVWWKWFFNSSRTLLACPSARS